MIVVDSEGIGGLDEDEDHDIRIFSLAVLLASSFLYNSVGSIDETALQNLSLVTNLTKHITSKTNGAEEGTSPDLMPSFTWVVRDFTLQLVDQEGEPITQQDYLEKALEDRKGADEQNHVRKELKRVFPNRSCCTLIRPLTNEEDLQNLTEMDLSELRSDFVEQVVNLRRSVLNKLEPKTIGGTILDGPSLAVMAVKYVDAINTGAIPNIKSTWQYICLEKATKQVGKCLKEFKANIDSFVLPQDHFELEASLEEHIKDSLYTLTKK